MNPTTKLLRAISSPFVEITELLQSQTEALKLYAYASKNKIGLLFLDALKKQGVGEFKSEYEDQMRRHTELLVTIARVSKLLDSVGIRHVIFKTIMPYLAVPNDVDVLILESNQGYKEAVRALSRGGYEIVGMSPQEVMFHDARDCNHLDVKQKDVYDVDLYENAAVSHFVYLEKRKLGKHVSTMHLENRGTIKVLTPEAELAAIIAHSVIVEQLYTLSFYYATLYYLQKRSSKQVNELVCILKENNIISCARAHFMLTAALHDLAWDDPPQNLEKVLTSLKISMHEIKMKKDEILSKGSFPMPLHYGWPTIIKAIFEKLRENESRDSLLRQAIVIVDPKLIKWVSSEVMWRRKRETY